MLILFLTGSIVFVFGNVDIVFKFYIVFDSFDIVFGSFDMAYRIVTNLATRDLSLGTLLAQKLELP